jgi:hypothetical protein
LKKVVLPTASWNGSANRNGIATNSASAREVAARVVAARPARHGDPDQRADDISVSVPIQKNTSADRASPVAAAWPRG